MIRDIPDHPAPGVTFRDITPLLGDPKAFRVAIDALVDPFAGAGVDHVVGVEARGFIVGAPVAFCLGAGFVPVRKPGKLPWRTHVAAYSLEYGADELEIHEDALAPGQRVLIVDDVLATGGTAAATCQLVEGRGATVVGLSFLVELAGLGGRAPLDGRTVSSVVRYG